MKPVNQTSGEIPDDARNEGRTGVWLTGLVWLGTLMLVAAAGARAPRVRETRVRAGDDAATELPMLVSEAGGNRVDVFAASPDRVTVLFFLSNDCPIANRYAPEIARLHRRFEARGVRVWMVHPATDETPEAIRRHAAEFGLPGAILADPHHRLVAAARVTVTPSAAVFGPGGDLRYHGRIDDRDPALEQHRPEPLVHDLEEAVEAVLAGRPVMNPVTTAVGCSIPEPD